MTDFTEGNGATRVAPGSHLLDDRLKFAQADTVPAEMTRGSVLFYNGAVPKAAAPTVRRRRGSG
jgi:ectoine hydroxylase-related dioxygenase (phytanoyl-CoA dioxygenase family)